MQSASTAAVQNVFGMLQSMFRACDSSGDNKVTLEEYLSAMGELPPADHKYVVSRVGRCIC